MIQKRTSRWLAVLTLLSGALLWGLLRFEVGHFDPQVRHVLPVVDFPAESIDFLLVERPTLRVECRLSEGRWFVTSPIKARADNALLRAWLDRLQSAWIQDTLRPADMTERDLTLADFGLESPRLRIVLGSPVRRRELLIGRPLPYGNHVYGSLPPSPNVYVLPESLFDALPDQLSAFRDKRLLSGDPRRVVQIDLRRPGAPFIQLARDVRQWRLVQPIETRADPDQVAALLTRLYRVRVKRFLWPPDNGDEPDSLMLRERLMVYGLDREENVLHVHLRETGQSLGGQLRIGLQGRTTEGALHAYWSKDGTLATIDADLLECFDLALDQWRDPHVLRLLPDDIRGIRLETDGVEPVALERSAASGRWRLVAPVADVADPETVNRFLNDLVGLRGDGFVDDAEALERAASQSLTRLTLTGPGMLKTLVVWPASDTGQWIGRVNSRPDGFRFTAEALPMLLRKPAGAVVFRDKTILALVPDTLRQVTRKTAAGEVIRLQPDAAGAWQADLALPAMLDTDAVEDLMFSLAHLRASRVETLGADDQAAYGLSPPAVEWIFESAEAAPSRLTLAIGSEAEPRGRYAAIRGRDVIFVLDPETAHRLCRPLVIRPEPR